MTLLSDLDAFKVCLSYDQDAGEFRWLMSPRNGVNIGDVAGSKNKFGHVMISLKGRKVYAHRLAWAFVYGDFPSQGIDHANGNPSDNRIANLRLCNQSQNNGNWKRHKRNSSGFRGVYWDKQTQRWCACIKENGKSRFLGGFPTPEQAYEKYKEAASNHFGQFFRDVSAC